LIINKESTIKYTILHLFADENNEIKKSDITSLLDNYRVLDKKNFSGHMKSIKKFISIDSKNNMSLTAPGKKEAEKIIEELNGIQ
jgi:LDH2 family malate/lactate/ureidoglycolate dehydrogenase